MRKSCAPIRARHTPAAPGTMQALHPRLPDPPSISVVSTQRTATASLPQRASHRRQPGPSGAHLLKCSMRILSARVSSPKSLTTTHEQLTTLRAFPSASILHRPAHSPSSLPSATFMRLTLCSAQSASTSFVYAASSHDCARMHSLASFLSRALAASWRPRARPSLHRAALSTALRAASMSMGSSSAATAVGAGWASVVSSAGTVSSSSAMIDVHGGS
mmetsp:Transcript_2854/g.9332  ORF Transcript_2854/g.9332 Transcript_2854/m.9332 type:complete len:218 (-) Transcript_2854:33-686(-)